MSEFGQTDALGMIETKGFIGMVEAAVYFCMIGMIDPNLRYSDSIRDQVTFKFAERSVVSAEPPRPCSSYMKCCLKL